jgi:hypothetical protein
MSQYDDLVAFSKDQVGIQPNGKINSNGSQLFSVPNNEEGRLFLSLARKFCNTMRYKVDAKGRDPIEGSKTSWGEVKVGDAQWLAVYLQRNYERRRNLRKRLKREGKIS